MQLDAIILTLCGAFATILVGIIKWGLNRIFSKIDEIAAKFEKMSESFVQSQQKIYMDMAHSNDKIWDRVDSIDRRLIKVEAQCALVSCRKDEKNSD